MSRHMDYGTAEHRYHHDPQFKQLVDLMTHHILQLDYSPSEMRDAAMLASVKFEAMKPLVVRLDEDLERSGIADTAARIRRREA